MMNYGQDAEKQHCGAEYLRIRYFPGGCLLTAAEEILIFNETAPVVTSGRRLSITMCSPPHPLMIDLF